MRRGRTETETCALNGWGVGTTLRGHETWGDSNKGVWTTMRITGVGEAMLLGRTVKQERTEDGAIVSVDDSLSYEHSWTLTCREWSEVAS